MPAADGAAMNEHLKLDLDTAIPSSTCGQCGAPFEPRTGARFPLYSTDDLDQWVARIRPADAVNFGRSLAINTTTSEVGRTKP